VSAETTRPSRSAVEDALRRALHTACTLDRYLIQVSSSERSLTHRLAVCLEREATFIGWYVDCEYNRAVAGPAGQPSPKTLTDGHAGPSGNVLPDVVVHVRGRSGDKRDLLVIEAKRSAEVPNEEDVGKLRGCRRELHYQQTAFVSFDPERVWMDPDREPASAREGER